MMTSMSHSPHKHQEIQGMHVSLRSSSEENAASMINMSNCSSTIEEGKNHDKWSFRVKILTNHDIF